MTRTRFFHFLLLASLLIQAAIACIPDTMGDAAIYRLWMSKLAVRGFSEAYWPRPETVSEEFFYPVDYPPLLPNLLFATGKLLRVIDPESFNSHHTLPIILIKLLPVCMNALITWLLWTESNRSGSATNSQAAVLFFAWNPAIWFCTAFWGQFDSLSAFFIMGALVFMRRKTPELSLASLTLGILTKPLVLPFAPLFLVYTVRKYPIHRLVRSLAAASVAALVTFLPFLINGQFHRILHDLLLQLDAMPYLTVNAHNIWWLAGGLPWISANGPMFGPLSGKSAGMLLFAIYYAIVMKKLVLSENRDGIEMAAVCIALGFFFLATHMHENHLFHFFPLACLLLPALPRLRKYYFLLSITFLANMMLHDPFFYHVLQKILPGPMWFLPPVPELLPLQTLPIFKYLASNGYTNLVEMWRGNCRAAWFVLTILNSQAGVVLFVFFMINFLTNWNSAAKTTARSLALRYILLGHFLVFTLWVPVGSALRFQSTPRPLRPSHQVDQ